uniref:Apple domain-containing protein n=1 Tax=Loa loa TaxID=7209 RepID=A0A1I7VLE6_LOALO
MTNTVSFTDSSINLLLFLLLSLSSEVGDCNASIDALKPCFEEHTDQRLSNLLPYHSEWRMKTPGQCLLFCALSSSRCRSTVHDTFQHICYYFLHDGQEYARTARGMLLPTWNFSSPSVSLIDQFLNGSNLAFLDSEFAISGISSSTPKYDTSTSFTELQWPAVAHSNPLIHVPPGGRAITPTPYFDYFDNQQKFKKHEKFDESNPTIATSIMTTDKTVISASSITVSAFASWPIALSKVLSDGEDQRLRRICPTDTSFRIFVANLSNVLIHAQRRFALEQSTHETRSSDDALSFVGNIGNLPAVGANFGKNRQKDDVNLNKLLKATPEDVRQLMNAEKLDESTNETSLNAEKSIVDRLTPISAYCNCTAVVCESNEREVWLIVENAVLRTDQLQKKASAGSYKSCRAKCNLITVRLLIFTIHKANLPNRNQ